MTNGNGAYWQLVWNAVLTLVVAVLGGFGAMIRWNWNKLVNDLNQKADIEDVRRNTRELQYKADKDEVDEKHQENIETLREIKEEVKQSAKDGHASRERIYDELGKLRTGIEVLRTKITGKLPDDRR